MNNQIYLIGLLFIGPIISMQLHYFRALEFYHYREINNLPNYFEPNLELIDYIFEIFLIAVWPFGMLFIVFLHDVYLNQLNYFDGGKNEVSK